MNPVAPPKRTPLRVVFLGDARINSSQLKTNILHRLTKQEEKIKSGAPFSSATLDITVDGFPVDLTVVDTSFHENNLEELKKSVYPNTDAFVFIFSLGEPKSLASIAEKWLPSVKDIKKDAKAKSSFFSRTASDVSDLGFAQLLLIGSDTHLKDAGSVKGVDAAGFSKEKKLPYVEVDSVSYDSVNSAVMELCRTLLQNKYPDYKTAVKTITGWKSGELSLKKKGLYGMPASFAVVAPEVKSLDLSNNELSTFPPELLQCTNLKELRIGFNHISLIPEGISNLQRLQTLIIENNALDTLPYELSLLKDLKDVKLKNNTLTWVPKDAIASTQALLTYLKTTKVEPKVAAAAAPRVKQNIGVRLLCARNLVHQRDRDHTGPTKPLLDPICEITFRDQKFKSKLLLKTFHPVFDVSFTANGVAPGDSLLLEVFDKEIKPDHLIGTAKVPLKEFDRDQSTLRTVKLVSAIGNSAGSPHQVEVGEADLRFVVGADNSTAAAIDKRPSAVGASAPAEGVAVFGTPLDVVIANDRKQFPHLKIPRILEQAFDYTLQHGLNQEGIFRIAGVQDEIKQLRAEWHSGAMTDFNKEKNPHNVSGVLKLFFREFPNPLLTFEVGPELLKAADIADEVAQIEALRKGLAKLPAANQEVCKELFPFMGMVTDNHDVNKMPYANLAKVLGPNLYWAKETSAFDLTAIDKTNYLVTALIQASPSLFEPVLSGWTPALRHRFVGHKSTVQAIVPDEENHIWSMDTSGMVRIWDAENCKIAKAPLEIKQRMVNLTYANKHFWLGGQRTLQVRNA